MSERPLWDRVDTEVALIDAAMVVAQAGAVEYLLSVESPRACLSVFALTQLLLIWAMVELRALGAGGALFDPNRLGFLALRMSFAMGTLLLLLFDVAVAASLSEGLGVKRFWESPFLFVAFVSALVYPSLLLAHYVLPRPSRWGDPEFAAKERRALWLNALAFDLHIGVSAWLLLELDEIRPEYLVLVLVFLIPRLTSAASRSSVPQMVLALLSGGAHLAVIFLLQ